MSVRVVPANCYVFLSVTTARVLVLLGTVGHGRTERSG